MVKKKSALQRFLEMETPIPKPHLRALKGRKVKVEIKGKRWERVSRFDSKDISKLVGFYWQLVGFKTRIRKVKDKHKPWEVDIKNFVTTTGFPTAARQRLLRQAKKRRLKEVV